MQLFSSSQHLWSNSKLPMPHTVPPRGETVEDDIKPEKCGWFDSSFDLATGLEVSEQDNDTLYQFWELSH